MRPGGCLPHPSLCVRAPAVPVETGRLLPSRACASLHLRWGLPPVGRPYFSWVLPHVSGGGGEGMRPTPSSASEWPSAGSPASSPDRLLCCP